MSAPVEVAPDAIDNLTAALGNQDISESTEQQDQMTSDEQRNAVLLSAAEGRRLYIGNLAYATTEGELQSFFKDYSIESTSIPKNPRTERPVGYAFVDLSTASDAERAIIELSGKEILERKVSVQLARKPEPEKSGQFEDSMRRRQNGRGRGRGRTRAGRAGRSSQATQEASSEEQPAANGQTDGATESKDAEQAKDSKESEEVKKVKEEKETKETKETEEKEIKEKSKKAPRPQRERHERGPPADGIPSKTKVMVANLPYDLSEEKLKELFSDYEPISAKIALRPIPRFMVKKLLARNEPRKGRGFGFVTLASNELQERAVSEMNGKEIDGREIAVKIAIDSPDKTSDEAPAQSAAAATEGVNGTTETSGAIQQLSDTNGVAQPNGSSDVTLTGDSSTPVKSVEVAG